MINEKRLKVLDANLLYLIGAFLFIFIGAYVQQKSLKFGLLITEYVLILLPPILYLAIRKINIKKSLRLNRLSLKHGLMIICITLLMYPVAVFANAVMMLILSLFGNLNIPQLPTAGNTSEYIVLMLIISISAGICEEVFFRGFMLKGYEALGKNKAIIISSILFGIFHFNLYNLTGPIVLGLVFGYLVVATDSLYAGIIGHVANNGFAVTLGFLASFLTEKLPLEEAAAAEVPTTLALLGSVVVFGIVGVITGFIAYRLFRRIKRDIAAKNDIAIEDSSILDEGTSLNNEVKKTTFGSYVPLLFVIPFFIYVAYVQIAEIIKLG